MNLGFAGGTAVAVTVSGTQPLEVVRRGPGAVLTAVARRPGSVVARVSRGPSSAWDVIRRTGVSVSISVPDDPEEDPDMIIYCSSQQEIEDAIDAAVPGNIIEIATGTYVMTGRISIMYVYGTDEDEIIIRGEDADDRPVFTGGWDWWIKWASYVTIKDIIIRETNEAITNSGLMLSGHTGISPPEEGCLPADELSGTHHITIDHVDILDIGDAWDSRDALKMTWCDDVTIKNCKFEGWQESAIDMLGCMRAIIEDSDFIGKDHAGRGDFGHSGIDTKCDSRDAIIRRCFFDNAADTMLRFGGISGGTLGDNWRDEPGLGAGQSSWQGKDHECYDCVFISDADARQGKDFEWSTTSGGNVHHNIFISHSRWGKEVFNILKHDDVAVMLGSHDGRFANNLVYMTGVPPAVRVEDDLVANLLWTDLMSDYESFTFEDNAYYYPDTEVGVADIGVYMRFGDPLMRTWIDPDSTYGVDPELSSLDTMPITITSSNPVFADIGPQS
jgi:hypothetical protein